MLTVKDAVIQQKTSNKASLKYYANFENHREHQTQLILSHGALTSNNGRICILGAGNCFDLDLLQIATQFNEVHLVDIDRDAIVKARSRLPAPLIKKVYLHAPVDISGGNKQLSAWRDMSVSPEDLAAFPDITVKKLLKKLPGPFDCVFSSCVISQILLTYRHIINEQHPLFEAGLITLLITHLRTLAALTKKEGNALLTTDISSSEIAPLAPMDNSDGLDYLARRESANQIFNYLAPQLLSNLATQDPPLYESARVSSPLKAWIWNNGPLKEFLVYALKITPIKN
jgi:hypothetical protein